MNKLTVVGAGPGDLKFMLPAGMEAIEKADVVVADERFLPLIKHQNVRKMGKIMETIEQIRQMIQTKSVAVIVSGDPLIYSLYKTIRNNIPEAFVTVVPGIGSMQMFASRMGETVENARFLSAHGRNLSEGALALTVYENEKVFLLCDKVRGPQWMAEVMLAYGLENVDMYAAVNLSYPEEEITAGKPESFIGKAFTGLCVVMIKNSFPKKAIHKPLLSDEDFVRGKTPMTKEEIRWTIIGKLKLCPDSIVWDIGAGTGSVSIECARQCGFGQVYAVERYDDAAALIQKNKEKFQTENLHIIKGMAADAVKNLPRPTHVFIGGSGKEMKEIIAHIRSLGPGITVMAACVTVETLAEASQLLKVGFTGYDLVQMNVSRGRTLGSYHILESNNPVTLVWAQTY